MKKSLPRTILLAEDDSNDVFIVQRAFKQSRLPYLLKVVSDGEEAISYLKGCEPYHDRKKNPLPDLTLLDIKMPRKTGLEVLEFIKSDPILKSLVVVILSSSARMVDVNQAHSLGANSYMVKPCDVKKSRELLELLCEYWLEHEHLPKILGEHSLSVR